MRKNIVANSVGRVWGIISTYIFIPLYLKFLGAEAYGLVGFYATLMGVLAFADMGLTATLNREMARLSVQKDSSGDQADLLRTYESVYAWISLLLTLLVCFLAPLIANRWLQSSTLNPSEITSALRLMGISIGFNLLTNLYVGGLMGLQKQVFTNMLQIGWSVLRGVGAVLVMWLLSPTVFAFFFWQLFVNIVYCFAARTTLWHAIPRSTVRPQFRWPVFQNTWRYALGMAGMAFFSTILTQTDKLAISKLLPLETFGYYMLAVTLANVPEMLASPIGLAVFPRFTGLVAAGDHNGLVRLYHRTAAFVSVAVIPGGLTLALFAGDFIRVWTDSAVAAERVGTTAALLLIGHLMQAIALVPYYVALAHGEVKLYLYLGITSVLLVTPLLLLLILEYGVIGAGLSWLVMSFCTLMLGIYFFHRRFMPGEALRWYIRDVGSPLLAALPLVLIGRWFLPYTSSRLLMFGLIGLVWSVSTVAAVITISELRRAVGDRIARLLGVFYEI